MELICPIALCIFFICGAITMYIFFWKLNKIWMTIIAVSSQNAGTNIIKDALPSNYQLPFRIIKTTIGLIVLIIMFYRYFKVIKKRPKEV